MSHQFEITASECGYWHGIVCRKMKNKTGVTRGKFAVVAVLENGSQADSIQIIW